MSAILLLDGYKTSHRQQYPDNTEFVYANLTPRSDKHASMSDGEGVVVFNVRGMLNQLTQEFENTFFSVPKEEIVSLYKSTMKAYLGVEDYDTSHIEALHDKGYLPVKIKSLPEGSMCPIGVPMLTIINEDKEFFWLTNYLETVMSAMMWHPITSATTARLYKKLMIKWAKKTGSSMDTIPFQCHDFSFRGMEDINPAIKSGGAHLTSFAGTDTVPSLKWLVDNYDADLENELVGCSIPATEHSVMCAGGMDNEFETYKRLITEVHPSGLVGIVSDTWDLWHVVTDTLPKLKDEIMAREGKVVIRPDSGDPADIICGEKGIDSDSDRPEDMGLIQILWDTFGGTVNDEGYKVLDSHIGAIYGDSITLERAEDILSRLESKGFASCNIVFGVGSYTYQMVTRDTYGFAMKATWVQVNGEGREIFKDPKTDDGLKKSAKGLLNVDYKMSVRASDYGKIVVMDQCTKEEEDSGMLEVVYEKGEILTKVTLAEIRERINNSI